MSNTKRVTICAILSTIVAILQLISSAIKIGPFSITLVLMPIVIGAALCGKAVGMWLGFVFGAFVLLSGDAGAFIAINPFGTFVTVLGKGILCGAAASLVYRFFENKNRYFAVFLSSVTCPVVNTGFFLICCRLFFMPAIENWAQGSNVINYMIFTFVGINFLIEVAVNVILNPVIIKIIDIRKKTER